MADEFNINNGGKDERLNKLKSGIKKEQLEDKHKELFNVFDENQDGQDNQRIPGGYIGRPWVRVLFQTCGRSCLRRLVYNPRRICLRHQAGFLQPTLIAPEVERRGSVEIVVTELLSAGLIFDEQDSLSMGNRQAGYERTVI